MPRTKAHRRRRLKPIPEEYNGVKFKSRMEANWARWLDEYNIKWEYEAQGFKVGRLWYLPDFWLPECNTIIEVKGAMKRINKAYAFYKALAEECGGEYCPDKTTMFILAGPAPHIYNIHPYYSAGLCVLRCRKCGTTSLVTHIGSYECRACGNHEGNHDIITSPFPVLTKPLEWLQLEEEG